MEEVPVHHDDLANTLHIPEVKALFRVAHLAQQFFYIFRELSWASCIERVVRIEKGLLLLGEVRITYHHIWALKPSCVSHFIRNLC